MKSLTWLGRGSGSQCSPGDCRGRCPGRRSGWSPWSAGSSRPPATRRTAPPLHSGTWLPVERRWVLNPQQKHVITSEVQQQICFSVTQNSDCVDWLLFDLLGACHHCGSPWRRWRPAAPVPEVLGPHTLSSRWCPWSPGSHRRSATPLEACSQVAVLACCTL